MPPHTASVQDRLQDPTTSDPSAGVNATNPWATAPRPDASERYVNMQPTHEGVTSPQQYQQRDQSEYQGNEQAYGSPASGYDYQPRSAATGGQYSTFAPPANAPGGNAYGRYDPPPPSASDGRRFLAPMAPPQQSNTRGSKPPLQATHSSSSTEPLRPTAAAPVTASDGDKDTYTASGVKNPHKLTQEEILEEEEMLRKSLVDWGSLRSKQFWLDKSMIKWYIATVLIM